VQFAQMSDAEIADYVESGEPLNVAGGFSLDGLSAPFITSIEGRSQWNNWFITSTTSKDDYFTWLYLARIKIA
jgi:hypothetical protein